MLHQNTSSLNGKYKKIISVVPSLTELLYDLGLNEEVVGITKFCIHPEEWFRTKTRIGGTKQLNIEAIRKLNPDLIIANKEENEKDQILELANEFNVFITDIKTLEDALLAIYDIGTLTNKKEEALAINDQIQKEAELLASSPKVINVAYLIWSKPYMTINSDTFIHHLIAMNGWTNVFGDHPDRYPMIEVEALQEKNPDVIFLSSEPFPFAQKHVEELLPYFPKSKIILVDGEMFSWYGSRLRYAFEYFRELQKDIG
ncbi:MAG: helical backbone metal receptor [Bacteroidetes bacterium]|nr:helical backbone metal receptor [Bacteroidota bacterium]